MGGLLTRTYIESDSYDYDIDKFAMVGTPNHGASSIYYIWEAPRFSVDVVKTGL